MKIILIGASGNIGQRILKEALIRGHEVGVLVRDSGRFTIQNDKLKVITGDILNVHDTAEKIAGYDIIISAYGPGHADPAALVVATKSLLECVRKSGVKRLIVVGGAGSLEVAPGIQLADTPEFPQGWKGVANAHRDALQIYLNEKEIEWSYLSPAGFIEPGKRTGKFRLGGTHLVVDKDGHSRISMEDFAVAMIEEAEHPKHIRKQFTLAY